MTAKPAVATRVVIAMTTATTVTSAGGTGDRERTGDRRA